MAPPSSPPPMLDAPQTSFFRQLPRGVAVVASTGAAIVSILTAMRSYGVIGGGESHQSLGNAGAAWVRLRPAVDTATAIGDTLHFAATVADRKGSILIGATPTWTTGDSSIATVTTDGSVIAHGAGTTTIGVVVGSAVSSARIVVEQRVASVAIASEMADSARTLVEGAELQLQARALDARGHVVPGQAALWRSDDSAVASVNARGLVVAQEAGRDMVRATIGSASATLGLTVLTTATSLAAVAGTEQRTLAGRALAEPVVVRATNRHGLPSMGKLVTFRLRGGQGTLEPSTVLTDADGRARTRWTLGDDPGPQTLLASVENVDSLVSVTAEAEPVARDTRVVALAESLRAPAGSVLSDSLGVRVTDTLGRALPGVPVRWETDRGIVAPLTARTDSLGVARARWQLAKSVGTQRLRAVVGGPDSRIAPVALVVVATAGPPTRLVLASGDRQHAAVGEALAAPVVVRVVDDAGNPAAGAQVSVVLSAGTVHDSTLVSDAAGLVTAKWRMGRSASAATMTFRVDGIHDGVRATALATPGMPANLSFDDAPPSRDHRAGVKHLVAMVADVYGNPVPDATVSFQSKNGAVTPARAVTDVRGRIAVAWTTGARVGDQQLAAAVRGSRVTGRFLMGNVEQAGSERPLPRRTKGTR